MAEDDDEEEDEEEEVVKEEEVEEVDEEDKSRVVITFPEVQSFVNNNKYSNLNLINKYCLKI